MTERALIQHLHEEVVPWHWAVETAEEQDQRVLHQLVPDGHGALNWRRPRGQAARGQQGR